MIEPLNIHIVNSAKSISKAAWDRLANPLGKPYDPFLSHSFFVALEESGSACRETGWAPMHMVAKDMADDIVGILPLYLKGHSRGEYVFDHGWARGFEMAGGNYYPKLLSAVPFTPVTGLRIFTISTHKNLIIKELIQAALKQGERNNLSSFHLNFIEEEITPILKQNNFLIRNDTQFHWQNQGFTTFDEFLNNLQSRKRKAIRKERKAALSAGLEVEWIFGEAIKEHHWDVFYQFYVDTFDRKWGTPYLTREFFSMIGKDNPDDCVLIFAKREEDYIAGALNFKGDDTLYGRYWGAKEHHAFLHFEICYYQAIEFALAHGLGKVEAGAQGEHKLLRGYSPKKTYSAHYILHEGLRAAVKDFLLDENHYIDLKTDILKSHLPYKKDDQNGL